MDKLVRTRANELELPRKLSIVHIDPVADYQENVETASRLITDSLNVRTLNLPIIMSATKAATTADILLRRAWIERNSYSGTLPMEYIRTNPGDILSITIDGFNHTILVTGVTYKIPGIIEFQGVAEDTAQYDSNATGGTGGFIAQTIGVKSPTNVEYLDIPLLRDIDNVNGFYLAAAGYSSGWSAASIYRSNDDGVTWGVVTGITNASVMGTASAVLADGIYTIFDYTNTINIRIGFGTLSTSTEAGVLLGANACMIGSELLQFVTATLEADSSYTLSGLLRGRKGTEWAMSTHVATERFVLLSETSLITVAQNDAQIGIAADYKAVTDGDTIQATPLESFTNNSVRLTPLSPVHIQASRDASNNMTITWIRRGRGTAEWRDYVDVPLGEATESYEVDIIRLGVVERTIVIAAETASYTAAQQITDGYTPGDPIEMQIYQLSAIVGRGYAGDATI